MRSPSEDRFRTVSLKRFESIGVPKASSLHEELIYRQVDEAISALVIYPPPNTMNLFDPRRAANFSSPLHCLLRPRILSLFDSSNVVAVSCYFDLVVSLTEGGCARQIMDSGVDCDFKLGSFSIKFCGFWRVNGFRGNEILRSMG